MAVHACDPHLHLQYWYMLDMVFDETLIAYVSLAVAGCFAGRNPASDDKQS